MIVNSIISIVIPTLNEEQYLPKLLEDLHVQSKSDYEVIIVDGRSEDKTSHIVECFKKKMQISLFQSNKRNVSFQRNYGAQKAKGQYVLFLDADVRLPKTFIKKLRKKLINEKGLIYILEIRPEKKLPQLKQLFDLINYMVMISQYTLKPFSTGGGSMIFNRHFFNSIGGFDDKLFISEDHEIIQRAQRWGVRAKFINNVFIRYSMRRSQHDGRIMLLYKYIRSTAHLLFVGKIEKKIFEYRMGGHIYGNSIKIDDISKKIKPYLSQVKRLFNKLLNE